MGEKKPDHTKRIFHDKKKEIKIKRKKSEIKKAQNTNTVHHRRPRSLDGKDNPANRSYVSEEIHRAWTIIAGNMSAEQICNHINIHFKPKGVTLVCEFINGHRCTKMGSPGSLNLNKMSYAWRVLFRECVHFKDKINFINNVLLDPSYHLYIKR